MKNQFKFAFDQLFSIQGRDLGETKSRFIIDETEAEPFDKRSLFGTPIYANLEIPAGEYTDLDGSQITFEGIRIDTVLFDISQQRNVVMTAINGRNGTIKQFISDGDYSINVQGILTGKTIDEGGGNFSVSSVPGIPEEEIRKFAAILKVPREIEVISEFLDLFGISTVVPVSYNFAEKEGSRTEMYFNVQFVSDFPVELK